MYAGAPLAFGALRRRLPYRERSYRLPLGGVLSPLAFIVASLIIYWSGWQTLEKLGEAIVLGYLLLGGYALYASKKGLPNAPRHQLESAQWLPVYLLGIGVISWAGHLRRRAGQPADVDRHRRRGRCSPWRSTTGRSARPCRPTRSSRTSRTSRSSTRAVTAPHLPAPRRPRSGRFQDGAASTLSRLRLSPSLKRVDSFLQGERGSGSGCLWQRRSLVYAGTSRVRTRMDEHHAGGVLRPRGDDSARGAGVGALGQRQRRACFSLRTMRSPWWCVQDARDGCPARACGPSRSGPSSWRRSRRPPPCAPSRTWRGLRPEILDRDGVMVGHDLLRRTRGRHPAAAGRSSRRSSPATSSPRGSPSRRPAPSSAGGGPSSRP